MPFIPHTEQDIKEMLDVINVNDIQQLFDEIPTSIADAKLTQHNPGMSELEMTRFMTEK
jgi:glycine dehydrogenase subunit 1